MTTSYNVAAAHDAVRSGSLPAWVRSYLTTGDWANWGLAEGLELQQRWWRGPLLLPLSQLARCCGPEPDMEYVMDQADWSARITAMAASIADPADLPPLIAQYRHTQDSGRVLSVRDGNKRHAALEAGGWTHAWTLIWYDSEQDYREHMDPT